MLLHQPARRGVVERVQNDIHTLQERAGVALRQLLVDCLDLDAGGAEEPVAQHLDLPAAHVSLAIELRADVMLLDAIAVNDAQRSHPLADEVVRQVRTERAAAAQRKAHGSEPAQCLGAAVELLVMELPGHRRIPPLTPALSPRKRGEREKERHRRGCTRQYCSSASPSAPM